MGPEHFESAYQESAPWDVAGPQPAFVELEEAGEIQGDVLDAGCGTGENALYLASKGHFSWGLDFIPVAIERAIAKAHQRGITAHFQIGDALELDQLGRAFDTVIDSGLFHTFGERERGRYVAGLAAIVRPGGRLHILCFSDEEPPGAGPKRIAKSEIHEAFRDGWDVAQIRAARFQTTDHPEARTFSPGGPRAWLATLTRARA